MWTLDEPKNNKSLTQEEKTAKNYFENTIARDNSGRFVVESHNNENIQNLSESLKLAKARFKCLQKRFNGNNELFIKYKVFLQKCLDLNHMSDFKDIREPFYFLPHHPVFKVDSTTAKLRVLFDASVQAKNFQFINYRRSLTALKLPHLLQQIVFN